MNWRLPRARIRASSSAANFRSLHSRTVTGKSRSMNGSVVFASQSEEVEPTYTRYLARRLREEFGFEGTPIRVALRKRRE